MSIRPIGLSRVRNALRRVLVPAVCSFLLHFISVFALSGLIGLDFLQPGPTSPLIVSLTNDAAPVLVQKNRAATYASERSPAATGNSRGTGGTETGESPPSDDSSSHDRDVAVAVDRLPEELEVSDILLAQEDANDEQDDEAPLEDGGDDESPSDTDVDSAQSADVRNESLNFEIRWQGVSAGIMSLAYDRNGSESRITSHIRSLGLLSALYRVDGKAESTMRDGRPVNFREIYELGRRSSNKETIFDHEDRKIVFINHRKGTTKEHSVHKPLWDFMSGFYFLRTQPLHVGHTVSFDVFDSDKFFRVDVDVLRKERLDVDGHQIDTLVIRPIITPLQESSEKPFQGASNILVWLSDDEARTPVRVEAKTKLGSVIAQLRATIDDNTSGQTHDGEASRQSL